MGEAATQVEMLPGAEPALDERDLVTINRFATWVGGDATSIKTRTVAVGIDAVLERQGAKFYRVADLFRAYSRENEFQRRARVQADEVELRVARTKGELIQRDEHVAAVKAVVGAVREMLDTIPDIVERDVGAPPEVVARIEQSCDATSNAIAERMIALAARHRPALEAEPAAEAAVVKTEKPAQPAAEAVKSATGGALDAAGTYLREILAAGPRLANEIIDAAKLRQISETSLRRAKSKLGIEARRAGKGWQWALPAEAAQDRQDGQQP